MRTLLLVFVFNLFFFSCKKSGSNACEEPDLNCAGINCLVHLAYFEFRLVDRNTGADLVFGANPRYSISDVELFSDEAHTTPLTLIADGSRGLFSCKNGEDEMYLVIDGTTTYRLNAVYRTIDCCTTRVKTLQVAGQTLCGCCADVINVGIT